MSDCWHCPYVAENLAKRPGPRELFFFLRAAKLDPLERAAQWALRQGNPSLAWRAYREAAWTYEDQLDFLQLQKNHGSAPADAQERETTLRSELHRLRALAVATLRPLAEVPQLPAGESAQLASQALLEPEPSALTDVRRQAWRAVALSELVRRQGDWSLAAECQHKLEAAQRAVAEPAAMAAAAHPASLTLSNQAPDVPPAASLPWPVRHRIDDWLRLRDVLSLQLRLLAKREQGPATLDDAAAESPDHALRQAAQTAAEALDRAKRQARTTEAQRAVAPEAWVGVLQRWLEQFAAALPPAAAPVLAGPLLRRPGQARHTLLDPPAPTRLHPVDAALAARTPAEAAAAWQQLPMSNGTIDVLLACERHYAWPLGSLLPALALALLPALPEHAATLGRFATQAAACGQVPPPQLVAYLTRALARSTAQAWCYAAPSYAQEPRNAPPSFRRGAP